MNWKTIKQTMALVAICVLLSQVTFAQGNQRRQNNPEFKKQVCEYRDQEIKPYLEKQKALLDSKLDKQSLEELNKLRAEACTLHKNGRNARALMREARKSNDENQINAAKESIRKCAADNKCLAEKLKPIIKKNPKAVKEIGSGLRKQSRIWRNDINKKAECFREANKDSIGNANGAMRGHNRDGRNGKMNRGKANNDTMQGKRAMARFMLWDGKSNFGPEE